MGSSHEYVDVLLANSSAHELEGVQIHSIGDRSDPEAPIAFVANLACPKPPKPEPQRSFARTLMLQPSKIEEEEMNWLSSQVSTREAVRNPAGKGLRRMQSSAELGLKGLRFLDKTTGRKEDGWKAVEKRFHQFAVNGRLPKEKFGCCIG
ncbi:putative respiratory burst oxidase homolog protein H [Phoenix dactylifera]|uniref:Respiratory burst oxidase homolog protein H n=1 Tax=Phoenix dactylifera TaxID=42345 RepID=A0A8B8IZU6_PHODC|nr:putative respiratory burst oxidase homolog protein H [Phoenix dactylifera]